MIQPRVRQTAGSGTLKQVILWFDDGGEDGFGGEVVVVNPHSNLHHQYQLKQQIKENK